MTQAFEIWYFCGGMVGCMDIFSDFVEIIPTPAVKNTKSLDFLSVWIGFNG